LVTPDPPSGPAPLAVKFDMCASKDPDGDPLTFKFDFGDGQGGTGGCRTTHVYPTPTFGEASARGSLTATLSVSDNHGHTVSKSYDVNVGCPTPTVAITSPPNGAGVTVGCSNSVTVDASASDGLGIARVDFFSDVPSGCLAGMSQLTTTSSFSKFGTDTTAPYSATLNLGGSCCFFCSSGKPCCPANLQAVATATCGATKAANSSFLFVLNCGKPAQATSVSWTSELNLAGGRGQVTVNGAPTNAATEGKAIGIAESVRGENRFEGQVLSASGAPGTWRFDLSVSEAFEPGSLRVTAGQVVELSARGVVFRLQGHAGERIAFAFRTR
jgi:hypothetical protein